MRHKVIGGALALAFLAIGAARAVAQDATAPEILVATLKASPDAVPAQTPGNDPAAIDILERHVAAIGGRDALKAIKTVETQVEREVLGTTSRVYRLEERATNRVYSLTEGANGKIELGFDGRRAWRKAPFFRGYLPESDPQTRAAIARRPALYEYKESGQLFKVLPKESVSGKEYLVLSTETTDQVNRSITVKYYFDPHTYLLGQTVRGTDVMQTTIFDDYRNVDGKVVAFLTTIVSPQATIKDRLSSIRYNVPVEGSKFEYSEGDPMPANTPAPTPTATAPLSEAVRVETFELVWRTVSDTYWDTTFGGVDWRAVHDKYLPLVKEAAAGKDFHRLMNQMVGEMNRSHFRVIPPENVVGLQSRALDLLNGTTGLTLRWIDNQLLVVDVEPDSGAHSAGVRKGFAVVRVGDKASAELLAEYRDRNTGFPLREEIERVRSANAALNGPPGSNVSVTFLDGANKLLTLELVRRARALSTNFQFQHRRLKENVGYIQFNIFLGEVLTQFKEAIQEFTGTKAIIIDLRGNPGGAGQLAPAMASLLSAKDGSLGSFRFRYETQPVSYKGAGDAAYKGRMLLLVDEMSASTSEVFAGGLQASKRAIVIGSRTAGAVLPSLVQSLPTGGALQHVISNYQTIHGTVLEGRGVLPDITAQLTRAELLADNDSVLARAIQIAQEQ